MSKEKVISVIKGIRIRGEHYFSKKDHDILRSAISCLSGTMYQSPECKCDIIEGLNNFIADEMLISEFEIDVIKRATNYIFESMKGAN